MAASLDLATVRHVARLARLHISEDELKEHASQLSKILTYVEQLDELDTSDVPPTAHAGSVANVFREDVPGATLSPEQALANAPDKQDTFFRVPKVLDQESS